MISECANIFFMIYYFKTEAHGRSLIFKTNIDTDWNVYDSFTGSNSFM